MPWVALPSGRFVNRCTGDRIGKLARRQHSLSKVFYEMGMLSQFPRWVGVPCSCAALPREDESNFLRWVMEANQSHGFSEVAVVGYDYRAIVDIQPRIIEQMDCQIDVRSFFFSLQNSYGRCLTRRRTGERRAHFMRKKVPLLNGEFRDRGF